MFGHSVAMTMQQAPREYQMKCSNCFSPVLWRFHVRDIHRSVYMRVHQWTCHGLI